MIALYGATLGLGPGGGEPTFAGEPAERRCCLAIHHHLHVVERGVWFAVRVDTTFVVRQVCRRVPPPLAQVHSSRECDAIIYDHELLVLRRADRVLPIQGKMHAVVGRPLQSVVRKELPFHRVDHREVPAEDINLEVRVLLGQRIEQSAQCLRETIVGPVAHEPKLAVDIPTKHEDRMARETDRFSKRAEVVLAIDDPCRAVHRSELPTILRLGKNLFHERGAVAVELCRKGKEEVSNEGYHEPIEELSDETRDMHRAIVSLMEELEAVDWYNQRVDACKDPELKGILAHNRDEEKEHAAMLLEWIRRRDDKLNEELEDRLFTDKEIGHEH